MRTITKMAKNALSDLLGDFEGFGFSLVPGSHSLLLQFKETILHSFKSDNELPITAECVQAICKEYLDKLNAQYN